MPARRTHSYSVAVNQKEVPPSCKSKACAASVVAESEDETATEEEALEAQRAGGRGNSPRASTIVSVAAHSSQSSGAREGEEVKGCPLTSLPPTSRCLGQ